MEFHELAASAGAGRDLLFVRVDEEADSDSGVVEAFAGLGKGGLRANNVETALGGDLLAALRDNADDIRFDLEGNIDDFGNVRNFEVKSCLDGFAQGVDIAVLNVAA